MKYAQIKEITRRLRNNQTFEEKKLWHFLRKKKLMGRKFLRQHALIYDVDGNEYFFYVPDFYCPTEKLAVELDGKIHDFQKSKDQIRDERLNGMGITLLRIKNEELDNIQAVLEKISACFSVNDPSLYRDPTL